MNWWTFWWVTCRDMIVREISTESSDRLAFRILTARMCKYNRSISSKKYISVVGEGIYWWLSKMTCLIIDQRGEIWCKETVMLIIECSHIWRCVKNVSEGSRSRNETPKDCKTELTLTQAGILEQHGLFNFQISRMKDISRIDKLELVSKTSSPNRIMKTFNINFLKTKFILFPGELESTETSSCIQNSKVRKLQQN